MTLRNRSYPTTPGSLRSWRKTRANIEIMVSGVGCRYNGSLFQYGLIPNGGRYFQRGMSLKTEVWVDHYPHGDRHERTTTDHGGAITRLFKRHAGGAI